MVGQQSYHKKMQENTIMQEEKFVNMMEKIADEQKGFYNQKKQHELMVKQTADMAKAKV